MTIADIDCETYSEAGFYWDPASNRWRGVSPSGKGGISEVGAPAYAEHPSTEILMLAWELSDGTGAQIWLPEMHRPERLFEHIARGGLVRATNSIFEYLIWHHVCHLKLGWPELPLEQLRDPAALCRSYAVPGGLKDAGAALHADVQKQPDGKRLITKFSCPRKPTKKNSNRRLWLRDDPVDASKYISYCLYDVKSQQAICDRVPELSPLELQLWQLDQRINVRGVCIDVKTLDDCISIVDQAAAKYTSELRELTGGAVQTPNELAKMSTWLGAHGLTMDNMEADTITDTLERDLLPGDCRRVLEIRAVLGAASVKKLYAIKRQLSSDGRLRDLFKFAGATRTARWSGRATQPQNLKSGGPANVADWNQEAIGTALKIIGSRNLLKVERYYPDPIEVVSGCLRGLFCAAPGHDLLCSDFSAIEAVCAAELAGETWRQEVFRSHGKIYEASASKITGIPLEEFFAHKKRTGQHHPMRKKIGKVAELASGYGGWIGAWKAFGADEFFNDDKDIKDAVLRWREESPAIVEMWGGQWRKAPNAWAFTPELYGLEGAAVSAVQHPGKAYGYRGILYEMNGDALYCRLPSGRLLTYHEPRLNLTTDRYSGRPIHQLSYMGWNTDTSKAPYGWIRLRTYGGKLFENVVQAVARDILAYSMLSLDANGYPLVLHVHDETVSEVLKGHGSIEHYEMVMGIMAPWCKNWPVRAAGGWRGFRFRKD